MARRRQSPLDELFDNSAKLPWWIGVALALLSYVILHNLAAAPGAPPSLQSAASGAFIRGLAAVGQYALPIVFLAGAVASALGRRKRMRLHANAARDTSHAAVRDLSWQDFELLVGEAFRRHGYNVEAQGGSAADGGVDLVLRKHGKRYLVQCKHWKAWNVGVKVVRELFGVMAAENADGGFVVTSGVFSKEARTFAADKHVVLMDGEQLHGFLSGAPPAASQHLRAAPAARFGKPRAPRRTASTSPLATKTLIAVILLAGLYGLVYFAQQGIRNLEPPLQAKTASPQQLNPSAADLRRAQEAEFEARYVPPKGCENWKSDDAMIDCGNHYIRAKQAYLAERKNRLLRHE